MKSLTAQYQKGTLKGIVINQQTQQPIPFASIALTKARDTTPLLGKLSDDKGIFVFNKLDTGSYTIKVIALGFRNLSVPVILQRTNQTEFVSLGLFAATDTLQEVVLQTQKTMVSNKLDKQIFQADKFETAKGGNAIDVLKNLPSIAVNSNGDITVRGASGFLLLVNGKPIVTDAATFLSQLPANTIENIELITAPSAKYDADGKAGIINITTKKGTTDGLAIQTNVLMGLPSTTPYNNLAKPLRFGGDVMLNYKKSQWDLAVSAYYNRNDINGRREGDVFTTNTTNQTITRFPSVGERSFDRYQYGGRAAVSFTPSKNNGWNFGLFAGQKYQQRRADIVYDNTVNSTIDGSLIRKLTYFNTNLQTKEGTFALASLDYAHTFSNKATLTLASIYEYANLYGNTSNSNLDYPAKNTVFQTVQNPYTNPLSGLRVKADYSQPIGSGKIDFGYQVRTDKQAGSFDYMVTPVVANQADVAMFKGTANTTNWIHAGYVQYGNKLKKLSYTTGLRYEYAKRTVLLSTDGYPHQMELSNLFPSVNLMYALGKAWSLKTGWSKRIQRNNNFELNPIPEREHSETLEQGDPNLKPPMIHLAEVGISRQTKNTSFFSTIYYQHIQHPVQRVNSVYADTILNRLFTNAEKAQSVGMEFGATIKPKKWLQVYLGANIYHYSITGQLNVLGNVSTVDNGSWVYSVNMNTGMELGKHWSLQANVNYLSLRKTAQGEDSRFFSPNTSVKKTIKNGRFSVALQWQNMNLGCLQANQQRITTWGKDFYTTTNYVYETDVLLLNFSMNLNKLSTKTKQPNSEWGEKEF